MNTLQIPSTIYTPTIDLRDGSMLMEGESFPEDPQSFYHPILEWLKQYMQSPYVKNKQKQTVFTCKLSYCNSSSRPFLLKFVQNLNKLHSEGHAVEIIWYYDANDSIDDDDINFKLLLEDFEIVIRYIKF